MDKMSLKGLFLCTYTGAERHVTFKCFKNTASRAETNVMMTSRNYICYCARYWWIVSFCDGPGMLICKTAKPCINSMWIALLIHGFVPVKTWLLIAWDTAIYAIMDFIYISNANCKWTFRFATQFITSWWTANFEWKLVTHAIYINACILLTSNDMTAVPSMLTNKTGKSFLQ